MHWKETIKFYEEGIEYDFEKDPKLDERTKLKYWREKQAEERAKLKQMIEIRDEEQGFDSSKPGMTGYHGGPKDFNPNYKGAGG